MNTSINFPNLGIHLSNVGKSISIGGFEIAYYGMIIACGMILGLCIAMWVAKKTNQNPDQYFDVALYAIPIALIGARAYYVIFSWDQYKDNLPQKLPLSRNRLYSRSLRGILSCQSDQQR